jgi:hypothetical protein
LRQTMSGFPSPSKSPTPARRQFKSVHRDGETIPVFPNVRPFMNHATT